MSGGPDELEELRHHWGEAYDIAADGGMGTATRKDGKGTLAGPLPEGLRIQAGHAAMPVPGEPAVNGGDQQREVPGAAADRALDALTRAWGDRYDQFWVWAGDGQWGAHREGDPDPATVTADSPDELDRVIRDREAAR